MPITRTAMIDDDGSGTTGTILNNAWKQELYNQIDAVGEPVPAAFTPGDGSGAALTFSTVQCSFTKTGKRVDVWLRLTYPATASGAPAIIAGLPFINGGQIAGLYQTFGIPTQFHLPPSVSQVYLLNPTNQASHTNATLSGAQLIFQGSYLTT